MLSGPAAAESKLALVVGINAYPHLNAEAQLQRAVSDAQSVGDALAGLGFSVTRLTDDTSLDSILNAFDRLTHAIVPGDTVVFYYAGHGISLDDGNYLVPSDVPALGPNDERVAKRHAIAERDISQGLRKAGARVAILVLDACRDNPFPAQGTRSLGAGTRGLVRMEPADGVFALYSAREGETALDRLSDQDSDPNSVFTRVFLKALKTPGESLSDLGEAVRDDVAKLARAANANQVPAVSNDLIGARSVFLAGPAKPAEPAAPPGPPADAITWAFIKDGNDPKQIEAFLEKFPDTPLRAEAEARLAVLSAQQAVTAPQIAALPPPVAEAPVAQPTPPADPVAAPHIAALPPEPETEQPVAQQAPPADPVAACDRAAALAWDETSPPEAAKRGIEGWADIDAAKAEPACRTALALRPEDPRLMLQLALALLASPARDQASDEIIALLRRSSGAGNKAALVILGLTYIGVRTEDGHAEEGLRWIRRAAQLGVPTAFHIMGEAYDSGSGVPRDRSQARSWYDKGAALGDAESQAHLQWLSRLTLAPAEAAVPQAAPAGAAAPDAATAATSCDRLAASPYDKTRPPGVAGVPLKILAFKDAIPACRAALESRPKDARLQYQLARALLAGKDMAEAAQYFHSAMQGGSLGAMTWDGVMRMYGYGVPKDETGAVALYRKAAAAGEPFAMMDLGLAYERGQGVTADRSLARRWYQKALAAGIGEARAALFHLSQFDSASRP